ncbi:DUF892 family protein [Methylobacterium sp. WL6]|uniref:DUF892 family protein n=1 Tax=Methylobacterium sp. WL6 TaxID=2603901 RepID=UPI0016502C66|nr:DUF892 family protein [Methylobacterium sp. WL6]
MSNVKAAMDVYLNGLRNQHAVEMQAVGTLQNEMPRMEPYPDLYAKMKADHERSVTQAARLDDLLAKHGSSKSVIKQAVTGAVATVAGFIHAGSDDEVLKNVLAAIGFKAYEISSYKVLLVLADAAGASDDKSVLEQSMKEEQEMGDWLGSKLPNITQAYLAQKSS